MHAKKQYLSIREVAKMLDVHPHTVRRWIITKALPCERIGRTMRVEETALLNWIQEQ